MNFLNGYGNQVMLTPEQQNYAIKRHIDLEVDLARREADFKYDVQKENVKLLNMEKRQEGIEARKRNRQNASYAIGKDSEGRFCLETTFLNGDVEVSRPVMNVANMYMTRLVGIETGDYVNQISWDEMNRDIILTKDSDVKAFRIAMNLAGIAIQVGRDRKKDVAELIFAYIVRNCKSVSIADHLGWNKAGDKWFGYRKMRIPYAIGKKYRIEITSEHYCIIGCKFSSD